MADAEKRFKKDLWNNSKVVIFMTSFDSWDNELYHYGVKGQKWGIRRYQNEDGSLTTEGKARYYDANGQLNRRGQRLYNKELGRLNKLTRQADTNYNQAAAAKYGKRASRFGKAAGRLAVGTGLSVLANRNPEDFAAPFHSKEIALANKYAGKHELSEEMANNLGYQRPGGTRTWEDLAIDTAKPFINDVNKIRKISSRVAIGGAAATAISSGLAAYNAIKAHAARTRLTEAGHSKAVAKAKAQVDRMQKMFGNIDLDAALKKK